jgi:hypothetical protein
MSNFQVQGAVNTPEIYQMFILFKNTIIINIMYNELYYNLSVFDDENNNNLLSYSCGYAKMQNCLKF